jgi:hypothetical protein
MVLPLASVPTGIISESVLESPFPSSISGNLIGGVPFTLAYIPSFAEVAAPCFNKGTLILILNKDFKEEWVPIETLTLGTLIKSYLHGYRKLKFIGCGTLKNHVDDVMGSTMYRLPEEGDMPHDLILTRGHSILVDTMDDDETTKNLEFLGIHEIPKLDDKKLLLSCASKKFIQINDDNEYTYYHIVLENDGDLEKKYGVWANGVLCETLPERGFLSNII